MKYCNKGQPSANTIIQAKIEDIFIGDYIRQEAFYCNIGSIQKSYFIMKYCNKDQPSANTII